MTDAGPALVKYMGNSQGNGALIGELIGAELANAIGLTLPDFAIINCPEIELTHIGVKTVPGPAFCSRWVDEAETLSPNNPLLEKITNPADISKLVVFDIWLRNTDRFDPSNLDNILLVPDNRKTKMVIIDHTHICVEGDITADLTEGTLSTLIEEQEVYDIPEKIHTSLKNEGVIKTIRLIMDIDRPQIEDLIKRIPKEWDITTQERGMLADLILLRGVKLINWLPNSLFRQTEMDFNIGK